MQKQQTMKKQIPASQQVEQVERDGHLQCQDEINWSLMYSLKKANTLPERAHAALEVRNVPGLLLFIWTSRCILSSVICTMYQNKAETLTYRVDPLKAHLGTVILHELAKQKTNTAQTDTEE